MFSRVFCAYLVVIHGCGRNAVVTEFRSRWEIALTLKKEGLLEPLNPDQMHGSLQPCGPRVWKAGGAGWVSSA